MRAYIDVRVSNGHYGNTSEYIRELIRNDQAEEAKNRLRTLIEEGLRSGHGTPWTETDRNELFAIANGDIE